MELSMIQALDIFRIQWEKIFNRLFCKKLKTEVYFFSLFIYVACIKEASCWS